jgi:predicted nucleic acid-binding protein
MPAPLIDANCLISFVTRRNPAQTETMGRLFQRVADQSLQITVIGHVVSETVFVLQKTYGLKDDRVAAMLRDLLASPGVCFHPGYFPERILSFWPAMVKDYGDAVVAAAAAELNLPVLTFDRNFTQELSRARIRHHHP